MDSPSELPEIGRARWRDLAPGDLRLADTGNPLGSIVVALKETGRVAVADAQIGGDASLDLVTPSPVAPVRDGEPAEEVCSDVGPNSQGVRARRTRRLMQAARQRE